MAGLGALGAGVPDDDDDDDGRISGRGAYWATTSLCSPMIRRRYPSLLDVFVFFGLYIPLLFRMLFHFLGIAFIYSRRGRIKVTSFGQQNRRQPLPLCHVAILAMKVMIPGTLHRVETPRYARNTSRNLGGGDENKTKKAEKRKKRQKYSTTKPATSHSPAIQQGHLIRR